MPTRHKQTGKNLTFVDTSAWFASVVSTDCNHQKARSWLEADASDLLTTDYVVDELLTLLRYRGEYRRALELGQGLIYERRARLEWVTPGDVRQAWEIFSTFTDKAWSFTDCVSRVVMERMSITQALAFDDDYRQFGTVTVLP